MPVTPFHFVEKHKNKGEAKTFIKNVSIREITLKNSTKI